MAKTERGLLHGTVELLILRTLSRGAMHGFAISRDLGDRSQGVVELKDAALYQALHRLERQGFVEGSWGHAESGKRAKFYSLTRSGKQRLEVDTTAWETFTDAVGMVLRPSADEVEP